MGPTAGGSSRARPARKPPPQAAALGFQAAALAVGAWALWRIPHPRPPHPRPPHPGTTVSLVIPARDEALPGLLASVRAQARRPDQLIVVDDHSTDATAAIAREAGATVVPSLPLPAGWSGKTWACHQGGQQATGDVLLFVDADVTLAPTAVERLLAELEASGGLVSVAPFHRCVRPYESLSAVCNVVTLMGTGAFTGPPRRPAAMAFGPCLLLRRGDYDRIGGHAAPGTRELAAEDIGLARAMRRAGCPVTILGGGGVVTYRMYPDGPGQLVQGWTKALGFGAARARPVITAATVLWVGGALVAAANAAQAAAGAATRQPHRPRPTGDLAVYAAWVVEMAWMVRRVGRFAWWVAPAYPVPLAAFVGLFTRSAVVNALHRQVRWRGRLHQT